MARQRKQYNDDDGRTIADMSDLVVPGMFGARGGSPARRAKKEQAEKTEDGEPVPELSRREQRMFITGAVGAALLIGLIFLAGLGLVIGLALLVWHVF